MSATVTRDIAKRRRVGFDWDVSKPQLLLIPEFTELEWVIRPLLDQWAEVATYDPPGVGDEPIEEEEIEALRLGKRRVRELLVRRGLGEVDRRGWNRFFLVADAWGNATALRIALERHDAVRGISLGHASLSYAMSGERAPVNREIWAGMRQLLRQDHREFIRYGIVQMTRGSVDEALAKQMVERFPEREFIELAWEALATEHEPIGGMLSQISCPLLLTQHQGCIGFTEDGFEDAVAAFPNARVARVPDAPGASEQFADALKDFCEEVEVAEAAHRQRL
jgi:pimeloyl-ACP methyl ester carboxylesterase